MPLEALVKKLEGRPRKIKGYVVSNNLNNEIVSNALAEQFGDVLVDAVKELDTISDGGKELGCGKRRKQANRLYNTKSFWMHGDDSSDEDI